MISLFSTSRLLPARIHDAHVDRRRHLYACALPVAIEIKNQIINNFM